MIDIVFVFGSNLAGRHGKGAAATALRHYGAKIGVGVGRQGMSYAIPTKDRYLKPLPLHAIQPHVEAFILHAMRCSAFTQFKVTRVGCGLAGYRNDQVAPMFRDAPRNCYFDPEWQHWLPGVHIFEELEEI